MPWRENQLIHQESVRDPDGSMCAIEIRSGTEPGMFVLFHGCDDDEGLALSLAELKRFVTKADEYHKAAFTS